MLPFLSVYDDASYDSHVTPDGHPERMQRALAARDGLALFESWGSALVSRVPVRPADIHDLLRVHSQEHVQRILGLDGVTSCLDEDTHVSPGTVNAALHAAGGAMSMALGLMSKSSSMRSSRFGLSVGRPPGHHATRDTAMGFCVFNNVAVAAAAVRAAGCERVAIVDWDAHHGNGTQDIFYEDPSVLYISVHNERAWPYTGMPDQIGEKDGAGMNVNVSIPAMSGDAVYEEAFRRIVSPVLSQFDPTLLLVSAGYDSYMGDPIGGFSLSHDAYGRMASILKNSVNSACPVGLVLEGGYNLSGLAHCLCSSLRGLLPREERRIPENIGHDASQSLDRVERAIADWWHLD